MRFRTITVIVTSLAWLGGCGGKKQVEHSGFLGDYSQLEPDERLRNAMTYFNPDLKIGTYDQCHVEPVVVHFAPNAEGVSVDPEQLAELAQYANEQLFENLSRVYTMVTSRRAGVVVLRCAITDIRKTQPAWNILPQTKVMGVGLGGASMEAEAIDGATGVRLAAIVDSRPGARLSLEGLGELDHAKAVVRLWITDFVERIEAQRAAAEAAG
jgi:hypothetical protein